MPEPIIWIFGAILYASGLLIWPLCLIFYGKRRSRRVRRMFFHCLIFQLVLAGFAALPIKILQHPYEWFFLMIVVNIVFTIRGLLAIGKDLQSDP